MGAIAKVKGFLLKLYRAWKVKMNSLLDRILDLANKVCMDACQLPWPAAQRAAKRVAVWVGDLCVLLESFPRLSVYKLTGNEWTVLYVGTASELLVMRDLFFSGDVTEEELGRVALWRLGSRTAEWLAMGIDLVICELSRIHPRRPQAPVVFTVPGWIRQALAVPDHLESLLDGRDRRGLRNRINRAEKAGFSYRFSRSRADFDHFYQHMYLPFIKARHGDLAIVDDCEAQRKQWFDRGGLVLVHDGETEVAGSVCYLADDTCFGVRAGVLGARSDLLQQGVSTLMYWYTLVWAHEQGVRTVDLGSSRPWRSNGVFAYKQSWGAKVARRRVIGSEWMFLARSLSPALQAHINQAGFVARVNGEYYGVVTDGPNPVTEDKVGRQLAAAARDGLAGIVVVSPDRDPAVRK